MGTLGLIAAAAAPPPANPRPPSEGPKAFPTHQSVVPWLGPVLWDLRDLRREHAGGLHPWI
jgi:hypothetical protein